MERSGESSACLYSCSHFCVCTVRVQIPKPAFSWDVARIGVAIWVFDECRLEACCVLLDALVTSGTLECQQQTSSSNYVLALERDTSQFVGYVLDGSVAIRLFCFPERRVMEQSYRNILFCSGYEPEDDRTSRTPHIDVLSFNSSQSFLVVL